MIRTTSAALLLVLAAPAFAAEWTLTDKLETPATTPDAVRLPKGVAGSANLNRRSFSLDEEINIVVLEPELIATLDRHFEEDLDRCVRIRPGRWDRRSRTQRTVEQFVVPLRRFF